MGLLLKYGSYSFPTGTTLVPITQSFRLDSLGRRRYLDKAFNISTTLQASGDSAITSAINTLEAALVDGNDLILYQTNGTTQTPHKILDASTTGTHVMAINYPESTGAEYANRRQVEITIVGTQQIAAADDTLTFSETYSYTGTGGARNIYWETIEAGPTGPWQVAENTMCSATQQGNASAYNAWPSASSPAWPDNELVDKRTVSRTTTRDSDGQLIYVTSWSYQFQSPDPFSGTPSTWT